jgi:hypothetical protein
VHARAAAGSVGREPIGTHGAVMTTSFLSPASTGSAVPFADPLKDSGRRLSGPVQGIVPGTYRIRPARVSDLVRTFVTTMLDAGVDLRDVQIAARTPIRASPCAPTRARKNLDRHPNRRLHAIGDLTAERGNHAVLPMTGCSRPHSEAPLRPLLVGRPAGERL